MVLLLAAIEHLFKELELGIGACEQEDCPQEGGEQTCHLECVRKV